MLSPFIFSADPPRNTWVLLSHAAFKGEVFPVILGGKNVAFVTVRLAR